MAEFKNELILQTESGQRINIDLRNALILTAAPTTSTRARAGMQAYVVSGGTITAEYVCTAVSGSTYTWVKREVSGGGSGQDAIFTATYGVTSYEEAKAASDSGKLLTMKNGNAICQHITTNSSGFTFARQSANAKLYSQYTLTSNNGWDYEEVEIQTKGEKVASIDRKSTDEQYPSAKAVYDFVTEEFYSGTEGNYTKLGATPVSITEKVGGIVLFSGTDGETTYAVRSPTVADMDSMAVEYGNCIATQKDGYIEYKSTGGDAFYESYVNFTATGLTAGETYTIYVDCTDRQYDADAHITPGYMTVYNDKVEGDPLIMTQYPDHLQAKLNAYTFTAGSDVIQVRVALSTSNDFASGVSRMELNDLYINLADTGTGKTSIMSRTGIFTGSAEITGIFEGVKVTAEPACTVFTKAPPDNVKAFYGKTIVCFGDSMFGYIRDETAATAHLAKHTGATVHNIGFGGCRMSAHPNDGYKEFSMYNLADAVATGDFSAQEAGVLVEGVPEYFAEHLAALENLYFNSVDYVVIHYGANDFTGGVSLKNDNNPMDTNTVCGALRYSLDKLLTAYPKLRIFVSVPLFRYWEENGVKKYPADYSAGGRTLLEVIDAIAETAESYCIPVINGYKGMGVNQYNADTFLLDKAHHTAVGGERFGKFIGAQMIANM